MTLKRESEINKGAMHQDKMGIERERLQTQREIAEKQLQVARENKNSYDFKSTRDKEK
jgi:hypothetical protein